MIANQSVYSVTCRDENTSVVLQSSISDLVSYIRSTETFQNFANIHGPTSAAQLLKKFENE